MAVNNPVAADGSTYGHVATTLPWQLYNGTLTNNVAASPSPLGEIEASFIQEDALMRPLHGIQLKHSL
jgi:hypothetical protein